MGGANHVLRNTILVFSFVALWHDLTLRLLAWGWLISLFVVPEMIAAYLLPAAKVCLPPSNLVLPVQNHQSDRAYFIFLSMASMGGTDTRVSSGAW